MNFDVTNSKPTYAQQYEAMKCQLADISDADEYRKLNALIAALKLGYLYGRAEGMAEINDIF